MAQALARRRRTECAALVSALAAGFLFLSACAAELGCLPLPQPPVGMSIMYYQDVFGTAVAQPTWDVANHALILPLGTLAVLKCLNASMDLVVGNRTQPTGTFNRTCSSLSYTGQVAYFHPFPPYGATIACQPPARPEAPRTKCASSHALCGSSSCCPASDTCSPEGLRGQGLCCPKGTSPCGNDLCCNSGEACVANNKTQTAHCCSKGTTPCGTEACCGTGEQCFQSVAGGRGVCCPGGSGYSPCIGFESHVLSNGQPWHCCEAGETCTLSLKEQEAWAPKPSSVPGRCMPKGSTRCGRAWCYPLEKCTNATTGECALKTATACGPSAQPCAPGHCLKNGTCCPASWKPCGTSSCCQPQDTCAPHANNGTGLCSWPGAEAMPSDAALQSLRHLLSEPAPAPRSQSCPKGGTACGDACCSPGETCNPKAAALDGFMACCPAGQKPCDASCCPEGWVCKQPAGGGDGMCCPMGGSICGKMCCGPGATCLASGMCCGGTSGGKVCGSTCCSADWDCVNGQCAPPCGNGGKHCGMMCCWAGYTCCGGRSCCPPIMKCVNGQCVEPKCEDGQQACGGACCGKGQVCSANGRRCCPPRDMACFLSGQVPTVQCGVGYMATCRFWNQSCIYFPAENCGCGHNPQDDHRCCDDGTLPCPNAPGLGYYKTCCPLSSACRPSSKECCPPGALLCGDACCGEGEWCAQAPDFAQQSKCFSRKTHRPCGSLVCPRTHTCYSGARFGAGLCCPPGQMACRGTDKSGKADWSYCCAGGG